VGFLSIWHNQLIIQNETSTRFRPHTLVTSVTLKGLTVPTLRDILYLIMPIYLYMLLTSPQTKMVITVHAIIFISYFKIVNQEILEVTPT
jgi:hypothetical protein